MLKKPQKSLTKFQSCIAIIGVSASCLFLVASPSELAIILNKPAKEITVEEIREIAQGITVKILRENESIGSGFIIFREGENYQIVTNAHVLRGVETPYQIQTYDNVIHNATLVKNETDLDNKDLALLEFVSKENNYPVAIFGQNITPGEEVYAAGFPNTENNFLFTTGKVSLILEKALEGGYQIGYTNLIEKGMSGSPLLNKKGEVIAINGMHANPLWGDPYIYEDGSTPEANLHQQMFQYSWGIPIQILLVGRMPFAPTL
jgi:serine protease DegQ